MIRPDTPIARRSRRARGYDRSLANPPPIAIAMRYAKGLREWLAPWHEQLLVAAMATYRDPLGRVATTSGHPDPTAARLDATLPRLAAPVRPPPPIRLIERTAADTVKHVDMGLRRVYDAAGQYLGRAIPDRPELRKVVGIRLRDAAPRVSEQLPAFRERNVGLITSIPVAERVDVQKVLDESWLANRHPDDVAKALQERFDISDRRADLIARDQVLKMNANVTEARHTALGIEEYTWSTSADERVRPGHAALDGTTQRYDDPPDTGDGEANNPGESFQCRCVAIPILPSFDDNEI